MRTDRNRGADSWADVGGRVGLVADPGVPYKVAQALAGGELAQALSRELSDQTDWNVEALSVELPLTEDYSIPVLHLASEYRKEHGWDVVVFLTDLPRRIGDQTIVSEFSNSERAAMVSLPALGIRARTRVRAHLVHLVRHLLQDRLERDPDGQLALSTGLPARIGTWLAPTRNSDHTDERFDAHLSLTGMRGRLRMLAGMVSNNRPWRLVPQLTGATAAASASAAFGIFYYSIWSMADALSPLRLALIMLLALAALAVWLIVANNLWDSRASHPSTANAALYNSATVCTVFIGVCCMYLLLYASSLAAGSIVIASSYLQTKLGHPAGPSDYATIAWLASSLGTFAGALGSRFDNEQAVRRATYSRREQARRDIQTQE